jgi:poly(hydroxyalkanoate) depolymerase family esterase
MNAMNATMQQAMRLMRSGALRAATRTLQQRLAGVPADGAPQHATSASSEGSARTPVQGTSCIDGEFRVVDRAGPTPSLRKNHGDAIDGTFRQEHFRSSAGALDYKLYIPAGLQGSRAPLLLMLHGCTQSPDDFAIGTRMNQLASEHGHVVAYPQQSAACNQSRCWNWFRGSDQQRGHGEPAMLAALTRHLVAQHGLDERRVYVAGLSAGGAMAAVLASTHPDVYAAIGVHSGLPVGLASDVPSAFAAMRTGAASGRRRAAGLARDPVPAIVFHGDGDTTVHPRNGLGVIAQSLGEQADVDAANRGATVERGVSAGGRRYTRTLHMRDGRVSAEHWVTHGAVHAWSGGDPAGSYTDPAGPDASAHMLRFFASCAHPARS